MLSSVHVESVFSQTGMFWRIGTNSSIVSSGLSPLPALTWTFITLYLFLTKWFYLFWDPQMRHMWTAHVDIFYCYVFCQTAENKIIRTGITELHKKYPRTKSISYDPHTYSMLVVCHLCIFEYCIKGALINSVRVCIICYTCTGKNPFLKGIAHSCGILQ